MQTIVQVVYMAKGKVTIYDIAAQLKVTPSTVSRALSDHPRISTKTKKAVRAVASKLNYQQNTIAAALRSGNTFSLGVVIPMINRDFFSSVITGIEEVARQAGYNVVITQSNDDEALEKANIATLIQSQVDGIIASIARETKDFSHYNQLVSAGIPLVLFDRVTEIDQASTVVIDDYLAAFKATEHLIQQGCRRIAHFAGQQHLNIYKYRLRGYQDALAAYEISFEEQLVTYTNVKIEDGRTSMRAMLELEDKPDAVFAASDYAAVGTMQVLKEQDIAIPEQVALVGFADEPFASLVEPKLTSVNQMSQEMGKFAAKIFIEQAQASPGTFIPRKTVLEPKLIIRASSLKKEKFVQSIE